MSDGLSLTEAELDRMIKERSQRLGINCRSINESDEDRLVMARSVVTYASTAYDHELQGGMAAVSRQRHCSVREAVQSVLALTVPA